MAPGRFCGLHLWPFRRPYSRALSEDTVAPQVPVPIEVIQPGNMDVCIAETTRPPSAHADVPTPATAQGSLRSSTGIHVLTEAHAVGLHSTRGDMDVPVPVHTGELSWECSRPAYCLEPAKAKEHVDRIRRFRILVMGKANAGKTTILKRVCNTTDNPEIVNGEGEKVDLTAVEGSIKRGYHNVENELVFSSNPRFVFHDSRGFEAGSNKEFDDMKRFVMDRARTPKLDKRIHAIWFCIPLTDDHRMVTAAEKKFFDECDTGDVPVIVLLTKAEVLKDHAVEWFEDQGQELSVDDTRVAAKEKEILAENIAKLKGWLDKLKFPPTDYLSLAGMADNEHADCTPLLACTRTALNEEGLQKLLISTQQTNLGLCIEGAIWKTLKGYMEMRDVDPTELAFKLAEWFPYTYEYQWGQFQGLQFKGQHHHGDYQAWQYQGRLKHCYYRQVQQHCVES